MSLNRRSFLKSAALTTAAATLSPTIIFPASTSSPAHFDFVFFTDTHIQPELDAAHGCDMAFRKIATLNSDFAIMGGDHVFDALAVDRTRANTVFDLYKSTEQSTQNASPSHHRQSRCLRHHSRQRRLPHRSRLRQKNLRRPHRQNLLLLRPQRLALHHPRLHPAHRRPHVASTHRSRATRLAQSRPRATPARKLQ